MKTKNILLSITFLLIMLTLSLLLWSTSAVKEQPISLKVNSQTDSVLITGWESEGTLFFFLPSYADLSEVQIKLESENTVKLEDTVIEDGMNCAQLHFAQPYRLSYSAWGKIYHKNMILYRSAGLAAAYIETQSGNMKFLHESRENSEPGAIQIYSDSGVLEYKGEIASISCRGNASWTETKKKSYGVTLAMPSDLLKMGAAEHWILLANSLDGTHVRNKIVHDAAKAVGLAYTADLEWIDLYLNGEYAGLYLLSEKNEIHPERVDIKPENSFLISGEMESRLINRNIPYISTTAKQAMRIRYPKNMDEDATAELAGRLQSVENAILSKDSIDPVSGKRLEDLIDLDSFAQRYLLDEVFGNVDGGMFSQFYYYIGSDSSGRLYAGPAWDYDLTMGSDYMWESWNPEAFYANRPSIKPGIDSVWTYGLCQKDFFTNRVIELYRERILPFLESDFCDNVNCYESKIESSAYMDRIRWKNTETLHDSINKIQEYMNQRKYFLNSIWLDETVYHCVTLIQGNWQNNAYYMVRPGECIKELPELNGGPYVTFKGWYDSATDEPFDITKPITEDVQIYVKWEEKSTNNIYQIIKMAPMGVIVLVGVCLLVADIRKNRIS